MTSCFAWLILLAFAILSMVSMIRWFEQITEAVDHASWNRVMLLLIVPPIVWMYESQVAAGRPMAVPRHEPVRGFGIVPTQPGDTPKPQATPPKKKRSPVDPAAIAKLKQKMKEQGMLGDDE